MSNNACLVVLGSLLTLTLTSFLSLQEAFVGFETLVILAAALSVSPILIFYSESTGSEAARWLSLAVHLSVPLAWYSIVVSPEPTLVTGLALGLTAAVGWGLADLGLYLENSASTQGYDLDLFADFVAKQRQQAAQVLSELSAYESGSLRPLAFESGGFRIPRS